MAREIVSDEYGLNLSFPGVVIGFVEFYMDGLISIEKIVERIVSIGMIGRNSRPIDACTSTGISLIVGRRGRARPEPWVVN